MSKTIYTALALFMIALWLLATSGAPIGLADCSGLFGPIC